jgi:arabinofuranan 3-O-arabinosyltransferase
VSRAEDAIFTRRRLSLCGYAFLASYVIAFAIRLLAGKWMIDKAGHPTYIDFLQWWVGGQFALIQNAAGAYNYSTFSAAQTLVTKSAPPIIYFPWVYPPTMLIVVAPIARLPYQAAFFAWIGATLCLYGVALYAILPELLTIVLALLPLPVVNNVFAGQMAFLTAGLLGLSLAFGSRRPYLSGICLGLLTYKPQFVLFFPFALLITGQWRVIAGAIASALLFAGLAVLEFGTNAWLLFLRSLHGHNSATLLPVNLEGVNQTFFGLMHESGAGLAAAWVVHLTVALIVTALACLIWLRPVPYALKAAAFSIGALTMTPYMLAYDLTALSVPAAFLIEDALANGFIPGERFVLMGCFLALFLYFNFAIGPIVLLILMGLVFRRARYSINTSAAIDASP